jgi:hypothetical protein
MDVLSTAPLSIPTGYGVSRIYMICIYTIQLIQILLPQSDADVRDWLEQLHIPLHSTRPPQRTIASLSIINFDQSAIVDHMPYGTQIHCYQSDRPNFHGYIFPFRADTSVLWISTNI